MVRLKGDSKAAPSLNATLGDLSAPSWALQNIPQISVPAAHQPGRLSLGTLDTDPAVGTANLQGNLFANLGFGSNYCTSPCELSGMAMPRIPPVMPGCVPSAEYLHSHYSRDVVLLTRYELKTIFEKHVKDSPEVSSRFRALPARADTVGAKNWKFQHEGLWRGIWAADIWVDGPVGAVITYHGIPLGVISFRPEENGAVRLVQMQGCKIRFLGGEILVPHPFNSTVKLFSFLLDAARTICSRQGYDTLIIQTHNGPDSWRGAVPDVGDLAKAYKWPAKKAGAKPRPDNNYEISLQSASEYT